MNTPPPDGPSLPPELQTLVDEWVERSGATGGYASEVRSDLEDHFREGLAAGRLPAELARAFGDPAVTAHLLRPDPVETRAMARPGHARAGPLDSLLSDLRLAIRYLRSSPVHTLTVMIVLALGIGANALTFTILNEIVLAPLPVEDQGSLVNVIAEVPGGNSFTGFSVADFRTLREQSDVTVDLAAYSAARLPLGEEDGDQRIVVTMASPGYFELLGVEAARGTVSLPTLTDWGADAVVVLSHAFWTSRLGADPGVVGSDLRIGGRTFTVIGVASEGFSGTFIGFPTDAWIPLGMASAFVTGFDPDDRTQQFLEMLGRRRPGVSVAATDAGLDRVAEEIERIHPVTNRGHRVRVVALTGLDDSLRVGVLSFVAILTGVALLVLLVACLNVGSILLVRALARERELSIRLAVGAGAGRIVRQLMTETGVLVVGATALAFLLSAFSASVLRDFLRTASGGLGLELGWDWRVIALTVSSAVVASLVAGVVPGLHILRKDPAGVLRQRAGSGRADSRARAALVVAQIAASTVLVVTAVLFARAFLTGLNVDPGFDADRIASTPVALDRERFDDETAAAHVRDIVGRIAGLPDVAAVAVSSGAPLGVGRTPTRIGVPGVVPPDGEPGFVVDGRSVGAGYFDAVGIELIAGGPFAADHDESPERVAVVSTAFADRFLDGSPPVGRSVEVDGESVRIIGVAEDVRYVVQDDTPDPLVYLSLGGRRLEQFQIVYRTRGDPVASGRSVLDVVRAVDPGQPQSTVRSARDTLNDALLPQRVGATVVGVMGAIALLLAAIGLYGLMQHTVARETRALGIRLALGGPTTTIVSGVLWRGAVLVLAGALAGGLLAFAVVGALGPFLMGVSVADPWTWLGVVGALGMVALGAALGPAMRAARVDPAVVLRAE